MIHSRERRRLLGRVTNGVKLRQRAPRTGIGDSGSESAGTQELGTGLGQPADCPPGVEASGATGSDSVVVPVGDTGPTHR